MEVGGGYTGTPCPRENRCEARRAELDAKIAALIAELRAVARANLAAQQEEPRRIRLYERMIRLRAAIKLPGRKRSCATGREAFAAALGYADKKTVARWEEGESSPNLDHQSRILNLLEELGWQHPILPQGLADLVSGTADATISEEEWTKLLWASNPANRDKYLLVRNTLILLDEVPELADFAPEDRALALFANFEQAFARAEQARKETYLAEKAAEWDRRQEW